jgi:hypothetical protein
VFSSFVFNRSLYWNIFWSLSLFLILFWTGMFSGDSSQNTTTSSCHFFFRPKTSLQLIMRVGRLTSGLLTCWLFLSVTFCLESQQAGYSSIQDFYCCYKNKGRFNVFITKTYSKPVKSISRIILLDTSIPRKDGARSALFLISKLCFSMYCLCVNVCCITATGW